MDGPTPEAGAFRDDRTSGFTANSEVLACELDELGLLKRGVDWATLATNVRRKERTDNGFRIVYDSQVGDSVRSLVDAERACCTRATWICETTVEGHVMEVTGPPAQICALARAFGI
jgi:hypothetical protein